MEERDEDDERGSGEVMTSSEESTESVHGMDDETVSGVDRDESRRTTRTVPRNSCVDNGARRMPGHCEVALRNYCCCASDGTAVGARSETQGRALVVSETVHAIPRSRNAVGRMEAHAGVVGSDDGSMETGAGGTPLFGWKIAVVSWANCGAARVLEPVPAVLVAL